MNFLCYNSFIMKKFVLIVLILAMTLTIGIGLTACNKATPQGQLANILQHHRHEYFEYDVLDTADNSTGTYTVSLDAYNAGSEITGFGTATLKNVQEGILVKGRLSHKDTIYETGCYYNLVGGTSYMVPAYSYRIQNVNGKNTFSVQGTYSGGGYDYTRIINGETSNGSLGASGTVLDNNQFQQALRSVTTFSSGLSLSFSLPLVTEEEAATATLTASGNSVAEIKTAYTDTLEAYAEKGIPCYQIFISRSTQVSGMSQTLYYAADNANITYRDWPIKNVLVKIVEPYKNEATGEKFEMQYSLKSLSIQ